MLGHLLEISIGASPLTESLLRFEALGFASVPVGDIAEGAYAVVSDGRLTLGLYDDDTDLPAPTFVRPELAAHVRGLRRAGVEFERLALAADEFHRAEFLVPSGCAVRLVEARTFSPPPPTAQRTVAACGEFLELSLMTPALEACLAFWQRLGFETVETTEGPRSVRLRGCGLTLGLHEAPRPGAALIFLAEQLDARRAYLEAKGFTVRRGRPLGAARDSLVLSLPGGVEAYLQDAA
jgi:catechol 2,3-dioxygenase-like lactoylglutathione lyase family enzyme